MLRARSFGASAAIVAALALVAACSGSAASPTVAPGAPTVAPGAPTVAPSVPTAAAPSPVSSARPSSGSQPSFAIPSFNANKNLEALLPSQFCGVPTKKLSFAGETFLTQGGASNKAFLDALKQLGKSPSDVSVAVAGVQAACVGTSFLALRIKGVDQGRLEQVFIAVKTADSVKPPTKVNLGGKDVWAYEGKTGSTQWIYFKGDVVLGVTAPTSADAAKALSLLP